MARRPKAEELNELLGPFTKHALKYFESIGKELTIDQTIDYLTEVKRLASELGAAEGDREPRADAARGPRAGVGVGQQRAAGARRRTMAGPTEALRLELSRRTAAELVGVIVVLLRQEEIPEALREFQAVVYEALGRYEAERARLN